MKIFAKTDIGRERKINQDFYYTSDPESDIKLFIIADGMGGYNGGEVASKMATEIICNYINENYFKYNESEEMIITLLKKAVEKANSDVYKMSKKDSNLKGMGTTIDICLIYNSRMYVAHIGDSRVYRIRKNFIRRITKDHSYVQGLIDDGTITREQATTHPKKNMITKALGCDKNVDPDIYVKKFVPGDMILMTTDGLTNMIKEEEIREIIIGNPEGAIDELINKANENGGLDNITGIIIF